MHGHGHGHGGFRRMGMDIDESERQAVGGAKALVKPKFTEVNLKRILMLAKREVKLLVGAMVMLVLAAFANLALPEYSGRIIDAVGERDNAELLRSTALQLVGVSIASAITGALRMIMFQIAGERVVMWLRRDLFQAIITQPISFHDVSRTGELVNRISADTTVLQTTVTHNLSMILRHSATVVVALIILFITSWKLTLVMLAVVPALSIGAVIYGRFIRNLSRRAQNAFAFSTEAAEQALSNIRTVRSFAKEDGEVGMYWDRVQALYELRKKIAYGMGGFMGGITVAAMGAITLVLWYGGTMVLEKELTIGVLTSYILYTLTIATALAGLSTLYSDYMSAAGASTRVFELLDRKPEINIAGGIRPDRCAGHVSFENVGFCYPSRPETWVLRNVSFTMQPGQNFALVGESGGGKSTIASLLGRFYDPNEGVVAIDGLSARDIDPTWLHAHVAFVSQEPVLFATSIRENIRYGRPTATDEEISAAAKMANAYDFIMGFPQGMDTIVGERGILLSGGQKQRVAIARAVIMDPRILVLDEATSALDAESEHLVQQALDRLMVGRTCVTIAHRLSTVKNAHCVCVMDGGRIVERGTHEELLAKNGVYTNLVRRQLAAPTAADGVGGSSSGGAASAVPSTIALATAAGDAAASSLAAPIAFASAASALDASHAHDHSHVHAHAHGDASFGGDGGEGAGGPARRLLPADALAFNIDAASRPAGAAASPSSNDER